MVLKCVKCMKSSLSREDLFLTFFKNIKTCTVRCFPFAAAAATTQCCSRIYAIKFFSTEDPSKTSAILLTYSVCSTHKR